MSGAQRADRSGGGGFRRGRAPGYLRRDLCASTTDGTAFSVMLGTGEYFLPAFVLALAMGEVLSGLIIAIPPLAGAVVQLFSPAGVRLMGSHRRFIVLCASLQAASFIPLMIVAWVGWAPPIVLFALVTCYFASGWATGPPWTSWIVTIVPRRIRSVYFGERTRWCQFGTVLGLVCAGVFLYMTRGGESGNPTDDGGPTWPFAVLFGVSAAMRFICAYYLSRQGTGEPMHDEHRSVPLREVMGRVLRPTAGDLGARLLVYMIIVQITVWVASPFFTPFMLAELKFSYLQWLTLFGATILTKSFAAPYLGRIAHIYGARRLLWAAGLGVSPIAALWLVDQSFWWLLSIQLLSGIVWACWEQGTLLLQFEAVHESERTSLMTWFNLGNASAMMLGSLVGGQLLAWLGDDTRAYLIVIAVSALLRAATVALLVRLQRAISIERRQSLETKLSRVRAEREMAESVARRPEGV